MNFEKPIKLLWTGGWDSTFRLLQIVLEETKQVQPLYFIDPARNSLGVEIQRMNNLKKCIFERYPYTKNLILPLHYVNIETIEHDEEIAQALRTLNHYVPLGSQYSWLAAYCKQNNIFGLEMSIEDGANNEISWKNLPFLKNNFSDNPDTLPDEERLIYSTSKIIFKYFQFPIININKVEMFELVKQKDWMPVMEKTWFCYQPLYVPFQGLVPCGNCITCRFQKKSGFNWRIPAYVNWFQKARKLKNKLTGSIK